MILSIDFTTIPEISNILDMVEGSDFLFQLKDWFNDFTNLFTGFPSHFLVSFFISFFLITGLSVWFLGFLRRFAIRKIKSRRKEDKS